MEMKKVLKYAMEIGEWMLKSGAGVSRVEDTISRICKAYGAKEANVFSITSSIVTTIEDEEGEIITQTKRIRYYKTDFKKLDELNQLSRYMCKYLPEEEEVRERVLKIKKWKYDHIFGRSDRISRDRSSLDFILWRGNHRRCYSDTKWSFSNDISQILKDTCTK